jgi:hypothetical protein
MLNNAGRHLFGIFGVAGVLYALHMLSQAHDGPSCIGAAVIVIMSVAALVEAFTGSKEKKGEP